MSALLAAAGLRKSFGPTAALRGVDLAIEAGEVVAVTGPSGSGKSTLLFCLAGILTPDGGEVTYAGRRLDRLSDRERSRLRRDEFGFVFAFGQLVPELRVLENVALPLLLGGRSRRASLALAADWLGRLGLAELAGRMPGSLSGGQSQRLAVARALITTPRLVFADEPTGSLDTVHGDAVMELLVGAARAEGAGVVVVTHEPRVAAYADRRLPVRDGLIREPAPPGPGFSAKAGGATAGSTVVS